ncbi:lipopolysaccharide biosynthesis protein [Sphingomonas sp. R86521]|uniref:lipopolysaccharide biosynthesis protein n=1 Tax=Sphingomonas sp. R86521 TaxID=3093860 RepID=UPI0036D2C442
MLSQTPHANVPDTIVADPLGLAADVDPTNFRRRAVMGTMYTGAAQAIRIPLTFALQIILGRILLPQEFGVVAMATPIIVLIEIFTNLGLAQAVVQREKITQADLTSIYWVSLGGASLMLLTVVLSSPLIARMYGQPEVRDIVIVLALQMPIAAIAGHASALMARRMRFGAIALVDVVGTLVVFAVSILAALKGAGYWSIVLGTVAGTLTRAVMDRQLCGFRPGRPTWSPAAPEMMAFGGKLLSASLLNYVSNYANTVVIGVLMGARTLGLFDRSFALVLRPIASVTLPVTRIAVPLLSRLRGDADRYAAAFSALLQGTVLIAMPGLITASVLAHDVVFMLLGKNWLPMTPMFSAISIAAIFQAFSGASSWLFESQNRAGEQISVAWRSGLLMIGSLLCGLPFGAVGIAISYAIFAPLFHGVYLWAASRNGPVTHEIVGRAIYPLFIAAIGAVAGALIVDRFVFGLYVRVVLGAIVAYTLSGCMLMTFSEGRRIVASIATLGRMARH